MEQLDLPAVAFGIPRVALGVREMPPQAVQLGGITDRSFGQRPMNHQVRVAPDRRREVRVMLLRQPEMPTGLDVISRPLERTQQAHPQGVASRVLGDPIGQPAHFRTVAKVTALDAECPDLVPILRQPPGIRFLMDAMQREPVHLPQPHGDGFVGQEHELLDQLVGLVVQVLLQAEHVPPRIEPDLDLARPKLEGTRLESRPAQTLRQQARVLDHVIEVIPRRLRQDSQRLRVRVAPLGVDHRPMEPRLLHPPFRGQVELHALRQPVHARLERTKLVAQHLRQHRDHPVHQIRRVAALQRLVVEGTSRLHVVRHVGDVHPHLPTTTRSAFNADRIVEILRVIRINRDDPVRPAVHAPNEVPFPDPVAVCPCRIHHNLRKFLLEVVLPEHRQHVHALIRRRAQHLDNLAFRIRTARLPFPEFHHNLVARLGPPG